MVIHHKQDIFFNSIVDQFLSHKYISIRLSEPYFTSLLANIYFYNKNLKFFLYIVFYKHNITLIVFYRDITRHPTEMNLLQSNDQDIYKCSICTKIFEDPIVTPDCMIYCEKCIIEWNSKNNTNPKGGVKSTSWVKNQTLNELLLRGQIFTNLNLL